MHSAQPALPQFRISYVIPSAPCPAHVIVLAAGMGRRFGGQGHKALAPLQYGLGTLPLLLRQLQYQQPVANGARVCVVTGHQADRVTATVREHMPTALCVRNTEYQRSSMLQSIATAMAHPELAATTSPDCGTPGAWILFADAFYHPPTLARLLATHPGGPAVAVAPWQTEADHPVGVQVQPGSENHVSALGPALADAHLMMVPAVYWPRNLWPDVLQHARTGLSSQWQLLQMLLRRRNAPPITAFPIACDAVSDIDTPADIEALRARWITPHVVGYFRHNLCKDERNLLQNDTLRHGFFVKNCAHEASATHEFSALQWLRQHNATIAPSPHRVEGKHLTLQHVPGIRLFDLLRLLQQIARNKSTGNDDLAGRAEQAAVTLLRRSLSRLQSMQRALLAWPQAATLPPYPLNSHVQDLLGALLHLLHLSPMTAQCRSELLELQTIWENGDACIPFRDATPKNILVAIPALAPQCWSNPEDRTTAVAQWLQDSRAAEQPRLVDIDFTSTGHRTAPEDDVISLLGHAGSIETANRLMMQSSGQRQASITPLAWLDFLRTDTVMDLPGIQPDPARAARALLVRYLRFGGRKLAYRIVNPTGYAVRFRHDDPAPYFRSLPIALQILDPTLATRWPALYSVLKALADAVCALPPWSPAETTQDAYLAAVRQPVTYWQESPLESMGTGS